MMRLSRVHTEAKRAKRWDPYRECYLDPKGNIAIDPKTLSLEAMTAEFAELEESQQRKWWGGGEEKEKEKEKEKEQEQKQKKIDEGIIDTSLEMNAENFGKMVDKVMAAKALEFKCSSSETGKKFKGDSDCKHCMKNCKVCSTQDYLKDTKVNDLAKRVRKVEDQILDRDKMLKFANDQVKKLTEKIDNDKIDVERVRKENEKLIHENRQISENFNKLKQTIQDSDEDTKKNK
ncbi:protein FAM133-like [Helianthus annuus]|uniref:protein FAM133-like n=1 Tax=Helianthus annuus TaxID=4232 RepID=UPI000B8F7344|nr:protein FAM133-like [Helianthus annuus]